MKSDESIVPARTKDLINQSVKHCSPEYSMFLDEKQCAEAEKALEGHPDIIYKFWGGYEGAQRKILCIYSLSGCDYLDELYSESLTEEIPIKCLTFVYKKSEILSHRDFLGSLMSMRLKRETIGDITVSEGRTQIFVTDTASKLICGTVGKIGRTGVKIYDDMPFDIIKIQEFQDISGTVASLRADSVISLALRISREKSAQLIKNTGVQINCSPVFSVTHEMKCKDVFSVKGYGKYILDEISGISKKGRLHINIKKYK